MSPRPVKNSPAALSSPTPGFHARVGAVALTRVPPVSAGVGSLWVPALGHGWDVQVSCERR